MFILWIKPLPFTTNPLPEIDLLHSLSEVLQREKRFWLPMSYIMQLCKPNQEKQPMHHHTVNHAINGRRSLRLVEMLMHQSYGTDYFAAFFKSWGYINMLQTLLVLIRNVLKICFTKGSGLWATVNCVFFNSRLRFGTKMITAKPFGASGLL